MNSNQSNQRSLDNEQLKLWTINAELLALSALFRNIRSSDFSDKEFYGISLLLKRLSMRISKISDKLEQEGQTKN